MQSDIALPCSGLSVQTPDNRRAVPGGNIVRDLLRRAAEFVLLHPLQLLPVHSTVGSISGLGLRPPPHNLRAIEQAYSLVPVTRWAVMKWKANTSPTRMREVSAEILGGQPGY